MRRLLASESGFTLIELVITLAILLIVLGPLAGYFITSSSNNHQAQLQMEANLLAERYMEEWKRSGTVARDADGKISTIADVDKGTLVVKMVATVVDNTIDIGKTGAGLAGAVTEPEPPTEVPDPYSNVDARGDRNPAIVMKDPVASAIENYQMGNGISDMKVILDDDFTASYTIDSNGMHDSYDTNDSPINTTDINISQGANVLSVGSDTMVKNPIYNTQISLVFLVNRSTPTNFNIKASQIPMKIYIFRGFDAATKEPYPEPIVTVAQGVQNVQVFRNLYSQPATMDARRLYQIDVKVFRKNATPTEAPLTTLTSYMRIK